jgi:hypothetical protein
LAEGHIQVASSQMKRERLGHGVCFPATDAGTLVNMAFGQNEKDGLLAFLGRCPVVYTQVRFSAGDFGCGLA